MIAGPRTPNPEPRPFSVEATDVWKAFGGMVAVRNLSLRVEGGRVLGLLGPNGAGKTTALKLLAGVLRPTRGSVHIGGRPLHSDRQVRHLVGFAGHTSFLYGHLSAIENLRFYAALYAVPPQRAEAVLRLFGLEESRHRFVRTLSRGLAQRLSLARALLHDPAVLLLDEPFTGLDATAAMTLRNVIADLRSQGRAIVMATHSWSEAHEVADRIAVLVRGRLAAHEPAAAIDGARLVALYRM